MDNNNVDNPARPSSTGNAVGDEAEGIWSADIEQSFLEALAIYPPCGRRKIILTEEGKMYGRNELVARYIKIRTGKTRTRKQVSSHLQVLAKRRSKEIQSLRNDKAAQQVILDRLKRYTSAEIVSMNDKQIDSDPESQPDDHHKKKTMKNLLQPMSITPKEEIKPTVNPFNSIPPSPVVVKRQTNKKSSTLVSSPIVYPHGLARSRCSSNTSSSSPLSSVSTGSQNVLAMNNSSILSPAVIGDEQFRLHELNAFVEMRQTLGTTLHPSLIYPSTSETYHFYQHDLLRLHANDIQMKTIQTFETISIDQISDKFPRHDGLKDLFDNNPDVSFFLIKFWADVSIPSSMVNFDESFFTTYTYLSSSNRPIHISTRLCSFGRQVLEKVDTSEHPQRDQFDQFIHRFDRSALCDYMVQFIQKLRSLPKAYMMNSVLENFTVLQVIKCLDNPQRLLLSLAFVFEIGTLDTGGPQYQVYKLVAN